MDNKIELGLDSTLLHDPILETIQIDNFDVFKNKSNLQDTGARKEFETGAQREIYPGKGRCDLLPLDIVAELIKFEPQFDAVDESDIFEFIQSFIEHHDIEYIFEALYIFLYLKDWDIETALLEVAIHYEDGAKKYSENNWKKGLPLHTFIDSGLRHYIKWLRHDEDEPHDRAFLWNMIGAIWTWTHKPELNDIQYK